MMGKEDSPAEAPKVTWGPITAILVTIAIYLGAQILGLLLVLAFPLLKGWQSSTITKWLDTSVNAQFSIILLGQILTLVAVAWFLKWRHSSIKKLGLGVLRLKWLFYSLGGYFFYFVSLLFILVVAQYFVPQMDLDQKQQLGFESASGTVQLLMVFAGLVVMPAFVEEIMARGFLYQGLKTRWPRWVAVIITSLLFGFAHLQFGLGAPLLWAAAIDTFVLSLILIWLLERTGSLWPAIGLHFIKNTLAFIFLFLVRT